MNDCAGREVTVGSYLVVPGRAGVLGFAKVYRVGAYAEGRIGAEVVQVGTSHTWNTYNDPGHVLVVAASQVPAPLRALLNRLLSERG